MGIPAVSATCLDGQWAISRTVLEGFLGYQINSPSFLFILFILLLLLFYPFLFFSRSSFSLPPPSTALFLFSF